MTTRRRSRQNIHATGRRLHLVDIENFTDGDPLTSRLVDHRRSLLQATVPARPGDAYVVAVGSGPGLLALSAWGPAQRLVRYGRDGADRALLDVLDDHTVRRFSAVTVYSGDGIFAGRIAELPELGVETTAVAMAGCLSGRLRMAAQHVIEIPRHLFRLSDAA
ncbi:NYN domain-containing protein [Antribacter gilvus]|uniref:NYN domain-containing protein n=1 Tax=Antribacter gilvus TaxID=2304675 RepID=UPI000F768B14|nr:NYN domain-containing protein [Antribacter gilvus]